jgi:hypothetical protein
MPRVNYRRVANEDTAEPTTGGGGGGGSSGDVRASRTMLTSATTAHSRSERISDKVHAREFAACSASSPSSF